MDELTNLFICHKLLNFLSATKANEEWGSHQMGWDDDPVQFVWLEPQVSDCVWTNLKELHEVGKHTKVEL